ncbi:AraC family transcriptional regulator [Embleya scabrispora]|uniref:AraC family transcriptional regulator n=1 Tax=Embleya scabrispora TaxID=159449 RepID=A0A1T3NM39_9ACTN|nr:AraC family transcriptional regulator [Embleya scabrispora]OPC77768.1 AraC family transcriptional regulator [Embleya scabrispora]
MEMPPTVVNAGVGLHGINSMREVFVLPRHWQLHLYGYSARYRANGVDYDLRPGTVSLVPPGTTVEYHYQGRSEHLYVHFEMPGRRDPLVRDAGDALAVLRELLRDAVASHPASARRSDALVWAALWRVADLAGTSADVRRHPTVEAVTRHIEAHLAEPLVVADLARLAGVSHNHLTRLFREQVGETVVGHIATRRMARALHLLEASTLSVSAIAAAVGIPDLQAFNKACRKTLGASPRRLRGTP